jgi:hypothetical protein
MMQDLVSIETAHGGLTFDAAVGNIPQLRLQWAGRWIEPLHSAPWRDEPEVQADTRLPLVDRRLAGDFFCAPFVGAIDPDVPPHGWTANSAWHVAGQERGSLHAVLERDISGAAVTKMLELADDAPLLYQEHVINGGSGVLPVAHHPMLRLVGAGRFFTSRKRAVLTPDTPLEPGHSRLAYPTQSADLTAVATSDDGMADLTRWPIGTRHEDFAVLVEAEGADIAWSAVIRDAEDDIVFFLKNPAVLPVTMLWFSNGGRDYSPWNGRHLGVVGIEDGCAPGVGGEAAAGRPNPIAAEGVATGLKLARGNRHVIRHVTGAIPRPAGWTEIAVIAAAGDRLTISDGAGRQIQLPWRRDFLKGRD